MTCPSPAYCAENGCSNNGCLRRAPSTPRFLVVPCNDAPHADLAVIWDTLEEQVVDVVSKADADRWSPEL